MKSDRGLRTNRANSVSVLQVLCRAIESRLKPLPDDSQRLFLSWQDAREQAALWLADCGYPRKKDVKGATVDLLPHLDALKAEGAFRQMILEAAARILKSRGADAVMLPPLDR